MRLTLQIGLILFLDRAIHQLRLRESLRLVRLQPLPLLALMVLTIYQRKLLE